MSSQHVSPLDFVYPSGVSYERSSTSRTLKRKPPAEETGAYVGLSECPRHSGGFPQEPNQSYNWEASLTEALMQGKPEAMESLVNHCFPKLKGFFLRRLSNPDLAYDCSVEVLLAVIKQIRERKLRHPERLFGYIMVIARRKLVMAYSTRHVYNETHCSLDSAPHLCSNDPHLDNSLLSRQQVAQFEKALGELSSTDRTILYRFYIAGHAKEKIAEDLGITLDQFRLRKWRAKERLHSLINRGSSLRSLRRLIA